MGSGSLQVCIEQLTETVKFRLAVAILHLGDSSERPSATVLADDIQQAKQLITNLGRQIFGFNQTLPN